MYAEVMRWSLMVQSPLISVVVCAGGVDVAQISPKTMECKCIPGLYVTGELLDVDGPCGGYNLQWAWASGYVAGRSACFGEKRIS
ncbi:MAG: NAD(P)/FAD-dependent oxidoreductase [Lachnospiraceae bacterium]